MAFAKVGSLFTSFATCVKPESGATILVAEKPAASSVARSVSRYVLS